MPATATDQPANSATASSRAGAYSSFLQPFGSYLQGGEAGRREVGGVTSGSGPMALRASYRIDANALSVPHGEVVAPYVSEGPGAALAVLGRNLIVEHVAAARRVVLNPTDLQWMLVAKDSVVATGTLVPNQTSLEQEGPPSYAPVAVGKHTLEGRRERWRMPGEGRLDVTWVDVQAAPSAAARALASMLLPSAAAGDGLIAAVAWWDGGATGAPSVRLTLTDVQEVDEPEAPAWREPDEDARLDELEGELAPFAEQLRARVTARKAIADFRRQEVVREAGRLSLKNRLRSEGQHYAWITSQPVLDMIREVVNAVCGVVKSFYGDGDGGAAPLHLVADWWGPLSRALAAADGNLSERKLATLLIAATVAGGRDLPSDEDIDEGLDEEEQRRWESLRSNEGPSGRLLDFKESVFSGDARSARRLEVLGLHKLRKIAAPREYVARPDGMPLRRFREELGGWIFEAWDFDTKLTLGKPTIRRLTFESDAIRLVLELDAIDVDCQWQLHVSDSKVQIALQVFTFGLWGTTNFHYGYADFKLKKPRVAFDLVPRYRRGRVEFETHVISEETHLDYDLVVTDGNPVGFGLTPLADALFLTVYDSVVDDILVSIVNEQLGEEGPIPSAWPELWRAVEAPGPASASVELRPALEPGDAPGVALWEGHSVRVPYGTAREVDGLLADPTAVALSPEYLAAWLRDRLGLPGYRQNLPSDGVVSAIGVELPPPGEIEDPDPPDLEPPLMPIGRMVSCGEPPAPPPPQSEYRLMLHRNGPRVLLDPPGETSRAGQYQYEYHLALVALRTYYRPVSRVYEVCVSGTDPAEWLGPGEFGGPGRGLRGFGGDPHLSTPWTPGTRLRAGIGGTGAASAPGAGPRDMGRGGFPMPGEPVPGMPFDFGSRSNTLCAYDCAWDFEAVRVNLDELLAATVTVTGDLIVDFDPMDLQGVDGGVLFPPLRLSVASDADYAPDVAFDVSRLSVAGPFAGSEDAVGEYLLGVVRSDAPSLLAPAVVDDRVTLPTLCGTGGVMRPYPFPVLERRLIPTFGAGEASLLLGLSGVEGTVGALARLLVHRQSPAGRAPRYVVRNGMVYWQVEVSERLTSLL